MIRIQAFVAVPPGSFPLHSKPAVVFAHGPGAKADVRRRRSTSAATSMWWRCRCPDRGSAARKGPSRPPILSSCSSDKTISVATGCTATSTPSCAPSPLPRPCRGGLAGGALTGFSLGGIATFIANGVDDHRWRPAGRGQRRSRFGSGEETWLLAPRLSTAAAHGAAATDRRAADARSASLQPLADPGAQALFGKLDPLRYARRQSGPVYMLVGAQDEYFRLPQVLKTFGSLRGRHHRLSLVADYDHGWYFSIGCPPAACPGHRQPRRQQARADRRLPSPPTCRRPAPKVAFPPYCGPQHSYNRSAGFLARWSALLRALVANHVARPRRPLSRTAWPRVVVSPQGRVGQPLAPAGHVRAAISLDCGCTFSQTELMPQPDGSYSLSRSPTVERHRHRRGQSQKTAWSPPRSPDSPATVCPPTSARFFPLQP